MKRKYFSLKEIDKEHDKFYFMSGKRLSNTYMEEIKMDGLQELVIDPEFKIGDLVYFMLVRGNNASIACGRIILVLKMDNLNTKYVVQGTTFTKTLFDTKIFATLDELIANLTGVIFK